MTEAEIHKAVIRNLVVRGGHNVFWFHPANGGKRSWSEGKSFKAMGVVAGVPDIIIIKGGEVFGLELKSTSGRSSPSQRLVHAAMQEAGAKTAIAKGLDEALVTLECWGILRRDLSVSPPRSEQLQGTLEG
jgi:hypothetical protein